MSFISLIKNSAVSDIPSDISLDTIDLMRSMYFLLVSRNCLVLEMWYLMDDLSIWMYSARVSKLLTITPSQRNIQTLLASTWLPLRSPDLTASISTENSSQQVCRTLFMYSVGLSLQFLTVGYSDMKLKASLESE